MSNLRNLQYKLTSIYDVAENHMYLEYLENPDLDELSDSFVESLFDDDYEMKEIEEKINKELIRLHDFMKTIPQSIKKLLPEFKKAIKNELINFDNEWQMRENDINKLFYDTIKTENGYESLPIDLDEFIEGKDYVNLLKKLKTDNTITFNVDAVFDKCAKQYNNYMTFMNPTDGLLKLGFKYGFDEDWIESILDEEAAIRLEKLIKKIINKTGYIKNADVHLEHGQIVGTFYGTTKNAIVSTTKMSKNGIEYYKNSIKSFI